MNLKHFEIDVPRTTPPDVDGWESTWYGYHEMTKIESQDRRLEYLEQERSVRSNGMMTEADFERDCLLSILSDIDAKNVNLFELGAGWGRISLALAGVIDFQIIPLKVDSYRCLAVEAEPVHYEWIKEHFVAQNINGSVIFGAVSDKSGFCRFNADPDPKTCYGQAISRMFLKNKIPNIGAIQNFLKRRTIKVPTFTVDQLISENQEFNHVDIIDVDVQGAEYDVVTGAQNSIVKGLISYWLIGTHRPELNDQIEQVLGEYYDLIVNVYPNSITSIEGFNPIESHDGIQLYKLKKE